MYFKLYTNFVYDVSLMSKLIKFDFSFMYVK